MSSIEKPSNPILEEEKKSRRRFAPRTPSDSPPVWTKHFSETYKEYYFYNEVTKESVWINTPEGRAIAKSLEGTPQDEKILKNIIPTPPSTPPETPKEQNKGNEDQWLPVKPYNPFKPPKFDEYGWPIFSQSSDESDKGNKDKKPSSDDKLGWDVDVNKLYEEQQKQKKGIEAPKELFHDVIEDTKGKDKESSLPSQRRFDILVKKFYDSNPYVNTKQVVQELEVKFGTKGIKQITRNDYDNVIKKLKSFGFTTSDTVGNYYLRINCEFLDPKTGKFK